MNYADMAKGTWYPWGGWDALVDSHGHCCPGTRRGSKAREPALSIEVDNGRGKQCDHGLWNVLAPCGDRCAEIITMWKNDCSRRASLLYLD
jgi:hypothetical protein